MTFLLWLMLAVPQQAMPAMGKSSITRTGPPPVTVSAIPLVLTNGRPLVLGATPMVIQ